VLTCAIIVGMNTTKHTVKYPDGHVLLRNLNKEYPVISYGKGIELFDLDGKRYVDAAGGALSISLGHGNYELVNDITEQLSRVGYVNGTQFTSTTMEEFADRLAVLAKPLGLDRIAVLNSGSEAIEAAIKYVRQLWVDRGQPKKTKLISRTPGYHGNTLFALSASGRPHYKKLYGPLLSDVLTVTAPYGYRSPVDDYEGMGADYYARELEALIQKEGADSIMAFIFEPVSGSSCGAATPPKNYFATIQEICKRHDILMIADEVMCGSGRTGLFFACEHYGIKPDVLVLGKSINSGYIPTSVVMVKDSDVQTIKEKSGYFMHAQTYLQSPAMAATGLAVLKYMERHRTLEKARAPAEAFQRRLREEISPLDFVGNISGIGHMAGVEFVEDVATKRAFARSEKVVERFVTHAQNQGLILWPNSGQANGVDGDLVMLGPPFTASTRELEEVVTLLKKAVQTFGFKTS